LIVDFRIVGIIADITADIVINNYLTFVDIVGLIAYDLHKIDIDSCY